MSASCYACDVDESGGVADDEERLAHLADEADRQRKIAKEDTLDLRDAKEAKPIRDKRVYSLFHERNPTCLSCGSGRAQAHHLLSRAQGGDDLFVNLVALCAGCHGALHGTPYRTDGKRITASFVKKTIGLYLGSEQGSASLAYLRSKRSDGWINMHFGVELA